MKRVLAYMLGFYTIYLYLHDLLIHKYPELPVWERIEKFDMVVILFGGIISGFLLVKFGSKSDALIGKIMIIVNLIIVPYLFMDALI